MPRFFKTPSPECPTVFAIAAPTPTGANFMTNSVKRNMISASDSHHLTTAAALAPMLVTASANITEKTTIWSTSPSAIALIIEAGERCAIRSPNDCEIDKRLNAHASDLFDVARSRDTDDQS